MRKLFEEYMSLWPTTRLEPIRFLLKDFHVLRLPEDLNLVQQAPEEKTLVVVDELFENFNPMDYLLQGFEHVLFSKREDFVSELFSSCLMSMRPEGFAENPIPFFFNGFRPVSTDPLKENNLLRTFDDSEEKPYILGELDHFLSQYPALEGIKDLCLQSADELIANALYNAPVGKNGERIFQKVARNTPIKMPNEEKIKFFACFSGTKVVIGCEDPFGSIDRPTVLRPLAELYGRSQVHAEMKAAGAGLGLKFVIGNSANFYMYCENKKKTLVACNFLLRGKRKNTSSEKHLHVSVR